MKKDKWMVLSVLTAMTMSSCTSGRYIMSVETISADSNGNNIRITYSDGETEMYSLGNISVRLDPNGGLLINQNSIGLTYGAPYELPTPDYEGRQFLGWYYEDTLIPTKGEAWTYCLGGTLVAEWYGVDNAGFIMSEYMYPQTEVKDTKLKSILTTIAGELPSSLNHQSWTSYEYYALYNQRDFMFYQDVVYEDCKYRGVYFTSYRITDCESFYLSTINSYQDDNGYFINNVYWFKWEPIEWKKVKDIDGNSILLSEKILDSQQFYKSADSGVLRERSPYDDPTKTESVYDNNYEYSDIREWLNNKFYEDAFSSAAKKSMESMVVNNSAYSTGYSTNEYACNNTSDKVFLLSTQDALNSYKNGLESWDSLYAYATDYAKCQGVESSYNEGSPYNGTSQWWLRSSYNEQSHFSQSIKSDAQQSSVYTWCYVTSLTSYGVRPAIKEFSIKS